MQVKRLLLLVLTIACLGVLSAQTITGTVKDSEGTPLIGASILVAGTTTGVVTDLDGMFTLNVPANSENLIITYTGFANQTIPLTGATNYEITLQEDSQTLDAVVVTGYGTKSRRRLTTSIASIGADELAGQPVTSFTDALQGRLSGVNINANAGTLGAQTSILVRGVGSINGSTQPLYVVDGVIIDASLEGNALGGPGTSPLNNINPADIESIDVLKDAASAAIYGSRGANGVILITTKGGNYNQEAQFTLNQTAGISDPTNQYDLLSGPEYARFWNQAILNSGADETSPEFYQDPDNEPDAQWIDRVTRTGSFSETSASVSGGSSDLRYFMSAAYRDEKGWTLGTELQRYAFNMNIEKRFGDRFNLGISLKPTRTVNTRQNEDNNVASPQTFGALAFPNVDPFDENGETRGGFLRTSTGRVVFAGSPLINIEGQDITLTTTQIISNAFASYRIIDGLSFRTQFGVQLLDLKDQARAGALTTDGFGSGGTASAQNQESINYTFTNTLNYQFDAGEGAFDFLLGTEAQRRSLNTFNVNGNTFADDRLPTLNSAAEITGGGGIFTESNFLGYFFQANYLMGDLTVQGSVRYDGSSRFGADNRFGWFPSASAAYDFSGLVDNPNVNQLKLRAGYGITGNAEIGNFASRGLVQFGNDYNGLPGFGLNSLGNTQLTWEESASFDVAVDFQLFSRLTGSVGYFNRTSSDLLFSVPIPLTTGVGAGAGALPTLTQNAGAIVNKGIEFQLTYGIISKPDFQWNFSVNGYTLDNEVTELVDNDGDGEADDIVVFRHLIRVGQPIGSWFMTEYAGVDPDNGDALFFNAEGEATNAFQQGDARRILGNSLPTFQGGFGTDLRAGGFDARLFFQFSTGFSNYLNEGRFISNNLGSVWNQRRDQLNAWTEDNRDTDVPQARLSNNGGQHSSRYLSKADFLRLRNVQIGYTFDNLGGSASSLRLYLSGQNLLTFTGFDGLDPEVSGQDADSWRRGDIFFSRPTSRLVSFGLNLNL